jgi:N6-adenosine-specific RNA methylase IME4/ParB-like chromosome segregation protein Spo0J
MSSGPRFHEVAGIFPMMSREELERLAEDIKANGQKEPIYTHDGLIVDGRNRFMACRMAGVQPWITAWNGKGSLVAFVVSLNLHRRHLDDSQRQLVAGRIATLGKGRPADNPSVDGITQAEAAELLNVSEKGVERGHRVVARGAPELVAEVEAGRVAVSTAAEIASEPIEKQREIVAKGEREILAAAKEIRARKLEERRQERVEKLAEISSGDTALDGSIGRFPIIYADPPWRYEHVEAESRAIENQYPTMALDEICALPVVDVCTDDAILFLWATSPKLSEAMRVVDSWGFAYRTCMVWDKEKIGMGYWARQQHELLLICTRGQPPAPPPDTRPASVVRVARGERHSAKPIEFYELIERMYPRLPRLELFCRSPRDGWRAWGNQAA